MGRYATQALRRAGRFSLGLIGCASAVAIAPATHAHSIFNVILTGGPSAVADPFTGTLWAGASLSAGFGTSDSFDALVFRADVLGPLVGTDFAAFQGAITYRWDIGTRPRTLAIATGLSGGYPLFGWRIELMAALTDNIALVAAVTPGVFVDGDDASFATPFTIGIDFGNF